MNHIVRTAAEGRTIAVVGDVYNFLATGNDTARKVLPCGRRSCRRAAGRRRMCTAGRRRVFTCSKARSRFTSAQDVLVAKAGTFPLCRWARLTHLRMSRRGAKMLIAVARPRGWSRCFLRWGRRWPMTTSAPSHDEIEKLLRLRRRSMALRLFLFRGLEHWRGAMVVRSHADLCLRFGRSARNSRDLFDNPGGRFEDTATVRAAFGGLTAAPLIGEFRP